MASWMTNSAFRRITAPLACPRGRVFGPGGRVFGPGGRARGGAASGDQSVSIFRAASVYRCRR